MFVTALLLITISAKKLINRLCGDKDGEKGKCDSKRNLILLQNFRAFATIYAVVQSLVLQHRGLQLSSIHGKIPDVKHELYTTYSVCALN